MRQPCLRCTVPSRLLRWNSDFCTRLHSRLSTLCCAVNIRITTKTTIVITGLSRRWNRDCPILSAAFDAENRCIAFSPAWFGSSPASDVGKPFWTYTRYAQQLHYLRDCRERCGPATVVTAQTEQWMHVLNAFYTDP